MVVKTKSSASLNEIKNFGFLKYLKIFIVSFSIL